MDKYMPGHADNNCPRDGVINILLVGSSQTRKLKKALEFEGEFENVSEAGNDDEMFASMDHQTPDVIIAVTDDSIPVEDFDQTLMTLNAIKMNEKTIIISGNPFRYFKSALKNKVAALVHRQISINGLMPIIREVYAWSHGRLVPCEIRQGANDPGLRQNQEVNEM